LNAATTRAGKPRGLIAAEIQTLLSTTARTALSPDFRDSEGHFALQFFGRQIA
jgi:hypothetical protein